MVGLHWRWWFDAAAHDPLLDVVSCALLVWIAGASESSGRGWSIDDEIVVRLAAHYHVEVSVIRAAFAKLERRGYIALKGDREKTGLQLGRVLFHLRDTSAAE